MLFRSGQVSWLTAILERAGRTGELAYCYTREGRQDRCNDATVAKNRVIISPYLPRPLVQIKGETKNCRDKTDERVTK